jgi:hypothetical protein
MFGITEPEYHDETETGEPPLPQLMAVDRESHQ